MPNFDLKSLSIQELKSLQKKVDREMAGRDKRMRKEALNAVREKAKQMGYSLDDLVKAGGKGGAVTPDGTNPKPKSRAPAAPKYRSKKDPSLTWSGRGRPPAWIKEARDAGIDIETMRIRD